MAIGGGESVNIATESLRRRECEYCRQQPIGGGESVAIGGGESVNLATDSLRRRECGYCRQ